MLGAWGLAALKWLGGPQARVLTDAAVNGRIVAAGAITSFLIPFAFSLVPALRGWRPDANDLRLGCDAPLADAGHRTRTVLVALQVGLAVILLVQVALLGRLGWTITEARRSASTRAQVLTFKMDVSSARFADNRQPHAVLLGSSGARPTHSPASHRRAPSIACRSPIAM